MRRLPEFWRPSPASRVAAGLVGLMMSLLMAADLFVNGLVPDRLADLRRTRLLAAELVAAQTTHALRTQDDALLQALLGAAVRHDPELLSAAVVSAGTMRAVAGDHARQWRLAPGAPSTLDNLRAAIRAAGAPWGELQLAFRPTPSTTWLGEWLASPTARVGVLIAVLGFLGFQLYLRRSMRYLDPSSAVPERVRHAFDTLIEGVLVLDPHGHVLLANKAFLTLGGDSMPTLEGSRIADLPWLAGALLQQGRGRPWEAALATRTAQLGVPVRISAASGVRREVIMNSTPIRDGASRPRGCLVTFSDVTELQERTERLRVAMAELHASRKEIETKNAELTLLATRDGLTGCLNRRAFVDASERAIEAARGSGAALCCVMCDVDHFKSVNDRFGHGGGDEVLKAVVKGLMRGLRTGDLLGRYGGEEFCILLPGADLAQALEIAERLRTEIEAHAGTAVRQFADVAVTMSFGVECWNGRVADFDALVDRADQALYHSKKSGRNRVTAWRDLPKATLEAAETALH